MKKKGFTLIELLVVIVTLSIITLIAIPTMLTVIDKSLLENNTKEIPNDIVQILYEDKEVEETDDKNDTGTNETNTLTREELTEIVKQLQEAIKKNKTSEDILNQIYPIGSVYITTDLATKEEVGKKLGGTWEVYATGRTLVGVDEENPDYDKSNKTGGQSNITLSVDNLPSHSHSYTPKGTISSTFKGKSVNTSTVDTNHGHDFSATTDSNSHFHTFPHVMMGWPDNNPSSDAFSGWGSSSWPEIAQFTATHTAGSHSHTLSGTTGWMKENNTHNHTATASGTVSSTFTGTKANTNSTGMM